MSVYVYEICDKAADGAIECRDYNNGEEKRHINDCNFGGNKLEKGGYTAVYVRKREISEEELLRISAEADKWRIYSVAVTYNPGIGTLDEYGEPEYYRGIKRLVRDIEAEAYLLSDGAFAGVVHFREDKSGSYANVALITDAFATSCEGDFPNRSDNPPLIYFYHEAGRCSFSPEEYYRTFYLGEK